jgi:ribosomal protein L11 methyltransferase
MNNYIRISISFQSTEQADILIAQLNELGYEGFEEEENSLYAFIPEEKFIEQELNQTLSEYSLSFSKQIIEQKNWNEEWEKNFQPVIVDSFCAIRASFHQPITSVKNEIIITPKMSFGTGHHATTYMMIEAMEQIDFINKSVFDFGTGTGVLSILAEKLGSKKIFAIDIDDWSIENAKENIIENGCSDIRLEKSDQIHSEKKFDIILANINKNVILPNMALMAQQLTNQGVLLVSGLLEQDFEDTRQQAENSNFTIVRQLKRENWICMELKKTNPEKRLTIA